MSEGVLGSTSIAVNDPDIADSHTFVITTPAANGVATVDAYGVVNYTPNALFNGSDSVSVTVTDVGGLMGTVTIPVSGTATAGYRPRYTSRCRYSYRPSPIAVLLVGICRPNGSTPRPRTR